MRFNDIKGIIFDKDGTLIEFQSFWLPVTYRVISRLCRRYQMNTFVQQECLVALGIYGDEQVDPEGQIAIGTYETISKALQKVFSCNGKKVNMDSFQSEVTQLFEDEADKQPYVFTTNLKELYGYLQSKNICVAIATTDSMVVTQKCLKESGMEIEILSTCDGSIPKKPDVKLIDYCASVWNTTCENVLMIGDTPNDLRFAKSAGAKTIGVLTGVSNKQALIPYADVILKNIGKLKNIV